MFNRDLEGLDRESLSGAVSQTRIVEGCFGEEFCLDTFLLDVPKIY
jgi:hypothetical protein